MAKTTATLLPAVDERLRRLGERLRLARQRRRLTAQQVAERAGMAPMTLRSIERGGAGVTIGAYLGVMQVLGVADDIERLAAADPSGRELQDARLPLRVRLPRQASPAGPVASPSPALGRASIAKPKTGRAHAGPAADGLAGFTSAAELAAALTPPSRRRKAG